MKTTLKGHSGREYAFDFGLNGWCRVEALTGKPISAVFDTMSGGALNATLVRHLLQGTLVGGDTLKSEEIGDVCDDLGTMMEVLLKLTDGVMAAGPRAVRPTAPVALAEVALADIVAGEPALAAEVH